MIQLWRKLGKPASGALLMALLLSTMAAAFGIALLGLSGWFLAAAAVAGAGGSVAAFNHLLPSTGVRAFAVARVASRYAEQLVGHEATLSISASLRPTLFERMARSQQGIASLPAGELAAITDDVSAAEGGFLRVIAPAFAVGAGMLVALGWAAAVDPLAALCVTIIFALVCVALPLLMLHRSGRAAESLAEEQAGLRSGVAAAVENAIELEIAGVLDDAMARATTRMRATNAAMDRLQRPFQTAGAAISFAGGLVALMLVGWAMVAGLDGAIAAGAALACLAAFEAASASARILDAAVRARASTRRLLARLDTQVADGGGQTVQVVLPLATNNVSVPVGSALIGPISLACEAGDIVELSGPSGVGKSTMLEAIAALRAVASGDVLYGGAAGGDARPASVLALVAVAPQFPSFLPGPLRNQIAYGRPDASDADVAEALASVEMTGAVAGREDADANAFSGGERRRLGIARAIVARPQLLLLDEPFAGLEDALADALRANLARWVSEGERAIIFTSHRAGPDWNGKALRRIAWPVAT
jgi:ATP-binding cassette subfamily C protein CydC